MRRDLSSSFKTPEFQDILSKYEKMKQNHTHVYFECNEIIHLAEYYAYQGNNVTLEEVIDYGLQLHPESIEILVYKCHNLSAKGKIEDATFLLKSIPDQNDREVRLTYGGLLVEQHNIESAEKIFQQLVTEECEINILLDIADIYMDASLDQQAYVWLKKAYALYPNNLDVLESMADYYYSFKSVEQATVFYNKLLDANPYHISYWIDLTRCYLQMAEIGKALEAIEFALAIDDKNLTCIELKGYCLQLSGDGASACKCYHEVERSLSNKARIQQVLLNCYFFYKKYDEAIVYCNTLLENEELEAFERASVYHKRAVISLAKGQYEACKNDIKSGLACDSEYSDLYIVQGELFISEGNMIEAESSFRKAESFAMEKAEAIQQAATAYMKYEQFHEAANAYKWMEKEYPEESKQYYAYMAFCYHRNKDEERMFTSLVRSSVYTPNALINPNVTTRAPEEDKDFFILAKKVLDDIKTGKLDPSSYL